MVSSDSDVVSINLCVDSSSLCYSTGQSIEIISITSMFNPGYAYVMLFAAMTLVLVLRPYGLLGTRGRE